MKYYIGVDGGGTKTAFALFNEKKTMLAICEGPGSNHENLDGAFDEASDIIIEGINNLCVKSEIKLSDVSFTLMGLAGVFRGVRGGIFCGCALASILRFLSSWITGATVWAEYMPEEFFGATMTSPWVYSALYNGFYSAVNGALCILIFALMYRPMRRYILAEDIERR